MRIRKNVVLSKYSNFRIGGPADFFVEVKNIGDAKKAVAWAKDNKQSILALGGGTNMLISDQGYRGLVIKLSLNRLEIKGDMVSVGAGVLVSYLLNQTLNAGLVGLEFLTGVPGTVGGAIRGNAGTYGIGMGDVLTLIRYLDEDYQLGEMPAEQGNFVYRHSVFKERKYIILEADLKLKKGDVVAARKLVAERLKYRQNTQPNGPSAGCIFKNVLFAEADLDKLKAQGLDIGPFAKKQQIPSAYLIDQAGLKGKTIGQAQVSEKHANYIINLGGATAENVLTLISFIKQQIRDEYGIQLQEEIQLIF